MNEIHNLHRAILHYHRFQRAMDLLFLFIQFECDFLNGILARLHAVSDLSVVD